MEVEVEVEVEVGGAVTMKMTTRPRAVPSLSHPINRDACGLFGILGIPYRLAWWEKQSSYRGK